MSLLRPDAVALVRRWGETVAAGATVLIGLWIALGHGYVLGGIGVVLAVLGLFWGQIAVRRARFRTGIEAPGVVEVDEAQVGYLGPSFGGFVSIEELSELQLIRFHGTRQWRLKQSDGQILMIPVAAQGAEALFDAFGALPGIDMGRVTAALDMRADAQVLWRRTARAALT